MKFRILSGSLCLVLPLLLATSLRSDTTKPDFSGKWSLNVAKSDFGNFLPLTKLVDDIVQNEAELKIHRSQANEEREVNSDIVYKFGEEKSTKLPTGESHTVVHWDGTVLVVELQIATSIHLKVIDRWSLSGDGRSIQIERQYGNEQGSVKQMLVLDKQ